MLEEGGKRRQAGGGRRGAGRVGGEAEDWEQRRKREDGRGAETGRRGKAPSRSERNNVERAEEGDSRREGVRVFGQQPPGAWSLSSTRYILGSSFCDGGMGLWFFWGMFCGVFRLFSGAGIWMVKILLLYLYNNLKQLDYGCK